MIFLKEDNIYDKKSNYLKEVNSLSEKGQLLLNFLRFIINSKFQLIKKIQLTRFIILLLEEQTNKSEFWSLMDLSDPDLDLNTLAIEWAGVLQ